LRLLPSGATASGSIRFDGREILSLPEPALREIRGREIAMIFQDPLTALNPVLTVGHQVAEGIRAHAPGLKLESARRRTLEILARVGLPDPGRSGTRFPHELSGGMRQRVLIAMALAGRPRLLLADEPTTALDATVQAQILALMQELKSELGMAMLWISHDLGVVRHLADEVVVMYAGNVVERSPAQDLFRAPLHPYTRALLDSLPGHGGKRWEGIPGQVPRIETGGCRFRERCALAKPGCAEAKPRLEEKRPGHWVSCFEVGRP
jgi:oligopeptide/dipeptide ABC transporter ATP-binding protein